MNIFSVLTLVGGLAMFLFGMNTMGDGLVKVSGGRLDSILEKLTSNRLKAVLLGTAVTAVIQSSSATTVMVIGFVNSGIMNLTQAVGVIMGANIGTTVTSWLLSLTGISGSGILISMLKPSSFSPILAVIGIVLTMTAKGNERKKDIGTILLEFAVLMFGMTTMSDAVEPLADNERFTSILTMFSNPFLGVLAGALLTAVIQSSSASIGILQALCATGAIPYSVALPIIMGQNIGTCVTALISAVGAGRNAKRASMMHLYFNLIGTIVFMVAFYSLNAAIGFAFLDHAANAAGIAVVHSLFNIGCCVAWFPFANLLVKLAVMTVPDRGESEPELGTTSRELAVLDDRFLEKPAFAVKICRDTTVRMAERDRDALSLSVELLVEYSAEKAEQVEHMERQAARYDEALSGYLMKISGKSLSVEDSRQVSVMLQCIRDFERIADNVSAVRRSALELHERGIRISDTGMRELMVYASAAQDIFDHTIQAFRYTDLIMAKSIEAYEKATDSMSVELRQRHVDRLRHGQCSMEAGLVLEDIITAFEHVLDHCSYVGACMIRVCGEEEPDGQEGISAKDSPEFREDYHMMKEKYALPERQAFPVQELPPGEETVSDHKKKKHGSEKGKKKNNPSRKENKKKEIRETIKKRHWKKK
ncbi:MAG: Na/Pi cotransporter family protein [Clostridiales bacterium]|nr:Na/Pi cotransporter family protein [Clostridiales bacterium]